MNDESAQGNCNSGEEEEVSIIKTTKVKDAVQRTCEKASRRRAARMSREQSSSRASEIS